MKKYFIILFLCMLPSAFAESIKLDLQSAINLAYENNSNLKRQKISLDAAARNAKTSLNTLLPSMEVSAGDTYIFPEEENTNSINLEGNVFLNLKSSFISSANKSKIDYEIEKINYLISKNSLRKEVSIAYFEILDFKNQYSLKKENLEILKELFEENKSKHKKGFLNEIDYLNSKILYEKSKSELLLLSSEKNNMENNFKTLLGLPLTEQIHFESDIGKAFSHQARQFSDTYKVELEALIKAKTFPEVKLLFLKRESADKEVLIKRLDAFGPSFSLSYQISLPINHTGFTGKVKNSLNAGIRFPLDNLFPISQDRQEINLAKDQIKDIDIQIEAKKQELEITLTNLLTLAGQKLETLESSKSLVAITESNLKACENSYSKGMLDFQNLKNANKEYLEAQLEYSSQLLEILKTFSSIEEISGKTMSEE